MVAQQYLHIIRQTWWIIIAALLIGTGIGLAYSYAQLPTYEATATFVTNPALRITDTGDLVESLDTLAGRSALVTSYCQVLKSQTIVEAAAASLGLSAEMVADYSISCVVLPDSSVLELQVQGTSPYLAADLANAIGASGVEFVGSLQEIYELRLLDAAVVNTSPLAPNHPLNALFGAVIGLMAGAAFVFLRYSLNEQLRGLPSLAPLRLVDDVTRDTTGAKVLVVDDDESIAVLTRKMLSKDGYQIQVAESGQSALRLAKEWEPDVVLLDIMMPDMDGFETCHRMRRIEATANVPIIMLTAKTSIVDKTLGFEAGADDYITKPFDSIELGLRVSAQLRRIKATSQQGTF